MHYDFNFVTYWSSLMAQVGWKSGVANEAVKLNFCGAGLIPAPGTSYPTGVHHPPPKKKILLYREKVGKNICQKLMGNVSDDVTDDSYFLFFLHLKYFYNVKTVHFKSHF